MSPCSAAAAGLENVRLPGIKGLLLLRKAEKSERRASHTLQSLCGTAAERERNRGISLVAENPDHEDPQSDPEPRGPVEGS